MKEIKAFVHRNRAADILRALKTAGFSRFSFNDVKGSLMALDPEARAFSVEFGEEVTSEVKIEFVCEDDRVQEAIDLLDEYGRTNQPVSGWAFVTTIDDMHLIRGGKDVPGAES